MPSYTDYLKLTEPMIAIKHSNNGQV